MSCGVCSIAVLVQLLGTDLTVARLLVIQTAARGATRIPTTVNCMKTITLNHNKKVMASEPYRPWDRSLPPFVGRLQEMKMATAAWIGGHLPPMSPLLVGEPGIGKNRLVYELCRRSGLELYILQGHEDVTAEDMACTVRFSDEPGKTTS